MHSYLSDADIVKALKRCSDMEAVCLKCPLDKTPDCQALLMKMAAERLHDNSLDFSNRKLSRELEQARAREKELLSQIDDLHKEILQYEAEMDWGDEEWL